MSARWMDIIMRGTLSGSARNLALAMADGANQEGECVMRLTTIRAYAGGVSETTAKRVMRQMEADGVINVERDPGGRLILIQLHQMDGSKMDGSKMDGSKMDGSKMDGSKMDGSKMDGSKEVVRIGKLQEESGLQDSCEVEAEANGSESRASAPSLPSPSSPLTLPLLSPNLSSPINPEVGEREDARGENPIPEQGTMFEEPEVSKSKPKKGPMVKPGKTEVMAFVLSMGLDPEDGEYIFENWEAGGWTRNGKPIKDWRACCRAWKAGRYFPSQKASTGRGGVLRGYRKIDYSKGF